MSPTARICAATAGSLQCQLQRRLASTTTSSTPPTPAMSAESGDLAAAGSPRGTRAELHPTSGEVLSFDTASHAFSLGERRMRSVSMLLRTPLAGDPAAPAAPTSVVPQFDAQEAAQRFAEASGGDAAAVVDRWGRAADFGTKFHEFIFSELTGEQQEGALRWTAEEARGDRESRYQQAFRSYRAVLEGQGYTLMPSGAEMLLCGDSWGLAGMVDAVFHCSGGNEVEAAPHYLLVDWKTNATPLRLHSARLGEPANLNWPFDDLPASKLAGYTLQTNLYKRMLEAGGYIPKGTPVLMCLVQFFQEQSGAVAVDAIRVDDLGSRVDSLVSAAGFGVSAA